MDDRFCIYIDRLRDGKVEEIAEKVAPDFLEVSEKDLVFQADVSVTGKAYAADDSLIIHLDVETEGIIPCQICNELTAVPVKIAGLYHVEPFDQIKGGLFNFSEVVREAILLEVPQFIECHEGNCPHRGEAAKYLRQANSNEEEDDNYHPFADLN